MADLAHLALVVAGDDEAAAGEMAVAFDAGKIARQLAGSAL